MSYPLKLKHELDQLLTKREEDAGLLDDLEGCTLLDTYGNPFSWDEGHFTAVAERIRELRREIILRVDRRDCK